MLEEIIKLWPIFTFIMLALCALFGLILRYHGKFLIVEERQQKIHDALELKSSRGRVEQVEKDIEGVKTSLSNLDKEITVRLDGMQKSLTDISQNIWRLTGWMDANKKGD
jgi:hypothetical protein